jgi:cell wall-associated NlpC family hydrolase
MDQMPTRHVDMHLRREISRNMELRIRPTDLNDWGFVGTAAAHCDIVVTDNQMAHLLTQPGLDIKRVVTAKLDKVPTLIEELSCSTD